MPKEKKSNLAIYTLAGSILLSSVIVSMNQVNAHSTSATKKEFLALKQCISSFQKDNAEMWKWADHDQAPKYYNGEKPKFAEYLSEENMEEFNFSYFYIDPRAIYSWIADGLEC